MSDSGGSAAEHSLAPARRWLESFEDFTFDEDGRIDRYLSLRRGELRADVPPDWARLHEDLDGEARRLEQGLERLSGADLTPEFLDALRAAKGLLMALRTALYDIDFDGDPNERYRFDRDFVRERASDELNVGGARKMGGMCPAPGCSESRPSAVFLRDHFEEHPRYRDGDFLLHPAKHRARVHPALKACKEAIPALRAHMILESSADSDPAVPKTSRKRGRTLHPWKTEMLDEYSRWLIEGLHPGQLKSVRAQRLLDWADERTWPPDKTAKKSPSLSTVQDWIRTADRALARENPS